MVSKKLKKILVLTIPLVAVHGAEEILTGFYKEDSFIKFFASFFSNNDQTFYWTFLIMWWLMLAVGFLLVIGGKWTLRVLTLFGIVYFFELHHVIKGIFTWQYYPGMITGAIYPVLGFFYWKELLKNLKGGDVNG